MAIYVSFSIMILFFIVNLYTVMGLETYIVHVEFPSDQKTTLSAFNDDLEEWYRSFLPATTTLTGSSEEPPRIRYSFRHVFTGFAADLSPEQVELMAGIPGFISAHPQKTIPLHTTHSPNFLALNQNMGFWNDSNYGRGVIIGVLDSGIVPDHPSFSDAGMPPPPARWKGICQFNTTACNNKLIGARYFFSGNGTPLDETGHGTHTAGTAAGSFVSGANVFGNANGTAAGIAPLAHIAVYKVCRVTCSESDVLAGMDAAIEDGVDVLSLSLGGPATAFFNQNVAVGAFRAIERGIFVSCSAGNDGPYHRTIRNGAPWVLTVGASTIDRKLRATAVLGDNQELDGESTFQPAGFGSTFLPLVYPGLNAADPNATFCLPLSLANFDLRDKIVLCETGGGIGSVAKGRAVRSMGGAAMILINQLPQGYHTISDNHVLPATHLSYADGLKIKGYLSTTTTHVATISFKGTIIGDPTAPMVGAFSSRGPNVPSPGILKPDIIGPGVNILAAWHQSVEKNTNTNSNFNIISGTSMSCPHLSGVDALLKNKHPNWSPAAIKSAIMTTADLVNIGNTSILDQNMEPANILATGSGHVNILKATDPGLVYDLSPADYIPYLCGLRYSDQQVGIIVKRVFNCSQVSIISESQLNYPSFSVLLSSLTPVTISRTVTNVGEPNSFYELNITKFHGSEITIVPTSLQFSHLNEKLSYEITFTRLPTTPNNLFDEGFLTWTSTIHSVRSPIVLMYV